jgi:hypothetical protein
LVSAFSVHRVPGVVGESFGVPPICGHHVILRYKYHFGVLIARPRYSGVVVRKDRLRSSGAGVSSAGQRVVASGAQLQRQDFGTLLAIEHGDKQRIAHAGLTTSEAASV